MPTQNPYIAFTTDVLWQNKHLNVQKRVARLYDVWNLWANQVQPDDQEWRAGLLNLQQVILDAQAQNRRVRPLGGGWSLSEVAATDDFLVNTKPLNFIKIGMATEHVLPSQQAAADKLVFAQCGISILELNQVLEGEGLSLKTSGASNGQTLAGAISTGTHGSANQVGSMQETVVGVHLVGQDGSHCWIERGSQPVVTDAFCAVLGTKLVRDDDLFNAALVSFGTFGIVHAVLFEVEPIYLLETYVRRQDVDDVRTAISTLDVSSLGLPDGGIVPFHFEVVINPYAAAKGQKGAFVRAIYKRPYKALPTAVGPTVVTGPGEDLLGVIGSVGDVLPALMPTVVSNVLEGEMKPVEGWLGTHGQTFGSTAFRGAGMSMEMGVPLAKVEAVVDIILQTAKTFPFGGVISLRYVKQTDALLGFTKFGSTTCTVELPSTLSHATQDAFDRICDALNGQNVPYALHWGQCLPNSYDAARVRQVYGGNVDRWLKSRRSLLLTASARKMFSNSVTDRLGLGD